MREVERRELDRHSYEVQIKELTLRISEEGSFKAENIKLREFLRKQSVTIPTFSPSSRNCANASAPAPPKENSSQSIRKPCTSSNSSCRKTKSSRIVFIG